MKTFFDIARQEKNKKISILQKIGKKNGSV